MRRAVTRGKLEEFMRRFGERASGSGTVYLVGGATALLLGMREQTVDIDLKMDPEPPGAFEAIAALKDALDVNVELASPDLFIPALPGWRERSPFVAAEGRITFRNYDPYGQALAKIERGHAQDLADARFLIDRGLVAPAELRRLFRAVEPELIRYPALDPVEFARKVHEFLERDRDVD